MEFFTTFDIEKKLGIPRNRLQQWLDRGIITPSIEQASGRRTKNRFSRNDLYRLELFQRLVRCGFSRRQGVEAAEESKINFEGVSESGIRFLTIKRKIIDDPAAELEIGSSELTHDPPRIDLDGDELGIVINLLSIKKRVDGKLA
jgi:DNA-binding transcriptional MerR regulator